MEFNVRFGDPETQPLLALLESPLALVLKAAADGTLDEVGPLRWRDRGGGRRRRVGRRLPREPADR